MMPDSTWVVRFNRELVTDGRETAEHLTRTVGGTLRSVFPAEGGFSAKLAPEDVEVLRRHPAVQVISPNHYVTPYHHPVQANAPWGLDRIDTRALAHLTGSYEYTATGAGVQVYIVDTGTNDHGEFYRLTNRSLWGGGGDCSDGVGHGTPVASVAAGSSFGPAKRATVNAFDALCGSGQVDRVIAALDWIRANHGALGPGVTNLSFGSTTTHDVLEPCEAGPSTCGGGGPGGGPTINPALDSAVIDLVASGMTVIAAAGNSDTDACKGSPGHLVETITVAASTPADARASFSNKGSCVDLFAPGVDIMSADKDGGSSKKNGTSLAAPFVAGVVALYLQNHPHWSPATVRQQLLSRATNTTISEAGWESPHRLLFSLEPLTVSLFSPEVSGPGTYKWEANPRAGVGHYGYQWYRRWVYGDGTTGNWQALGTGKEQWLTVNEWEPDFDIRVDVISGTQSASASNRVRTGCDPCIESVGETEAEE
jgi:aqualysin 1